MAGMKFEYDENGGKFYYFFLSFYALILLPATYWLWPKPEKRKSAAHPEDISSFAVCQEKYQLVYAHEPSRRRRARLTQIGFLFAWIVLIILVYRVSIIEIEHKDYDPFAVLNVDRESAVAEIKRAYRDLSKKHHPDRGGDPEQFKEIAKAYKTLTDEEAKENWKKYGNPDGPGVTHFGIALPKWLVDHQNAIFVLLIYTGVFMIVLPVIICIWWQKSARYAGDHILTDTSQLYFAFLSKTSSIPIKRIIMILSVAKEFDRTRNPLIVDRPSDNIELPKIIREIPGVQEKTREGPLQFPYCIKARALLHAHIRRFDALSDDLEKDKRYIVKRSIYLISEMVNIAVHLLTAGLAGHLKNPPHLDTFENIMKLSPMIVQALVNTKSPLLQLPHINETHLKFFETKKRTIRSLQQFIALEDEQRRSILRSLTDEQYSDIINALSIYPYVTMNVSWGVFDDENEHKITTGAVVTLTVHLHRESMSILFSKEVNKNSSASTPHTLDEEVHDEQTNGISKSTSSKVWNNKSDRRKKSNKDKGKKKVQSTGAKSNKQSKNRILVKDSTDDDDDDDDDSSKHSHDSPPLHSQLIKEDFNGSENDEEENTIIESSNIIDQKRMDNDDDEFLEKFQRQQRKREKLETKAKISARVFCPFYPEIKQECWWLYVADRKRNSLISVPVYICTLKDDEEIEVKFKAPKDSGRYDYSVHLRSDSYLGVDVVNDLPLTVEAAKETEDNHPQWNFDEDEGGNNAQADDEQFATESDSDHD